MLSVILFGQRCNLWACVSPFLNEKASSNVPLTRVQMFAAPSQVALDLKLALKPRT